MKAPNIEYTKQGTKEEEILSYAAASTLKKKIDRVTVEEPLQIKLRSGSRSKDLAVIMRTPVQDYELAVGFLFSEGIISDKGDILSIKYDRSRESDWKNVLIVEVADSAKIPKGIRQFTMNSGCGLCGKTMINDIFVKGASLLKVKNKSRPSIILKLPDLLKENQSLFGATGGTHAAGLFNFQGQLIAISEDVGRHNAVDKIVGYMILNDLIGSGEYILQLSGRAGFEIVQKAIGAGIPIVCSVSAPSSLAIETANTFGATLVSFVRNERYNIYTHPERLES